MERLGKWLSEVRRLLKISRQCKGAFGAFPHSFPDVDQVYIFTAVEKV